MPLPTAELDTRTYQDLLDETRRRIPVHTPEWTNFNKSDPGITLLELFAFLTESLLYRANQIPDRNRRKFLTLLGVPLRPATAARGMVAFADEQGPLQRKPLDANIELRGGNVSFRTEHGVDILPVEARAYYKRPRDLTATEREYYEGVYAPFLLRASTEQLKLYETASFPPEGLDLAGDTIDGAIWIAMLRRVVDKPQGNTDVDRTNKLNEIRKALANRILSLGIVPRHKETGRRLLPAGSTTREVPSLLQVQVPNVSTGNELPTDSTQRIVNYRSLTVRPLDRNVLEEPGVLEVTLPDENGLWTWTNLAPQEAGTGNFPPPLDDTTLSERLITWLRISPLDPVKQQVGFVWIGINAATVTQRDEAEEPLPDGTGEPDQSVTLAHAPVLPGSVRMLVQVGEDTEIWSEVTDFAAAGPEVPTTDPLRPPGGATSKSLPAKVFTLDAEAGRIMFGDGTRGARPSFGAKLRAKYGFAVGAKGNLLAKTIDSGPTLPDGVKVFNPIRTWGGANAETVAEGEKQIARFLQHRDRLVTAEDFQTITLRAPSADLARVDVIPAYSPALARSAPGDAAGAVTLMVVPRWDREHPETPEPDPYVLSAVCEYLDSRRLVTTEVYLRGPDYVPIWISVGLQVIGGRAMAPVIEAVQQAIRGFLSPLPKPGAPEVMLSQGWPRSKPVVAMELLAVASRVPGVQLVNEVQVARSGQPLQERIDLVGLELPRVLGLSVALGDAIPVDQLRGQQAVTVPAPDFVPVPSIPQEC
jgi:hypothetical protein